MVYMNAETWFIQIGTSLAMLGAPKMHWGEAIVCQRRSTGVQIQHIRKQSGLATPLDMHSRTLFPPLCKGPNFSRS